MLSLMMFKVYLKQVNREQNSAGIFECTKENITYQLSN